MSTPTATATELTAALVEATRRIGSDPDLALFGGGNSSVKFTTTSLSGESVPTLLVKGSGHDMATITAAGFCSLRLEQLRSILPPVVVPVESLMNELLCARLDASAPDPSVESLVHAMFTEIAVLHSHADFILALSNSVGGRDRVVELLGDACVVVDYAMPGPDLVAACSAAWRDRRGDEVGIVVLGHGLFTVGDTPQVALERHLELVARAAAVLGSRPVRGEVASGPVDVVGLASLRKHWSQLAGRALIVRRSDDGLVREFLADTGLLQALQAGPLTPDHVSWTKPFPAVGTDLEAYAQRYQDYFDQNCERVADRELRMLDPAPRVLLDAGYGMLTAGRTPSEAAAVATIEQHTMDAIRAAVRLGGYEPAGLEHTFDLEYWHFQQQKLARTSKATDLGGQVALVTGAASGIGRGCAAQLLEAGATVVGWDLSPSVAETFDDPNYLGLQVDVTDPEAIRAALAQQVGTFGGLDILVVAAGIFPPTTHLGELDVAVWKRTMTVNVDSVMELYNQAGPLLAQGYPYGRVALVASKNVAAPGPGAAAYSSSKAAVTQLTRVAALEWAAQGVRVNMVHPDAVFDTGLWTPELLAARAEHYGMSVADYKRRNLLRTEITSASVGKLVRELCSESFACTTGAQVPIDGGNERVI